jgi:hypothetical protein
MRKILLVFVFLLLCPILPAQQTLDNDAVIKLAKAGLSDDLIITTIDASPGHYDISPDAMIALKAANLSDKVVAAIVLKANGVSSNAAPAAGAAADSGTAGAGNALGAPGSAATGPNGLPVGIDDVGVYFKDKSGAWVTMLPEIVNFQSSGKLKDFASAGVLRSDLEGRIEGSRARVDAKLPVVFAVYLPETVEITEYLLLELHPIANARTFLSAAGGLLHTQAGARRDEIDFQPEKLAPRLYQITLPASQGKGEYGLLAPGNKTTSNKEASAKIYTVSVAE